MFKFESLRLYRKFLILAVLAGTLLTVSSVNKTQAAAAICCSACDDAYNLCVYYCYQGDPRALNKCLQDCDHDLDDCYQGPPTCNVTC